MEGVSRMPMLSVEAKICVAPAEFTMKFKEYIVRHYQEDPDKYDKSMEELDNLRENACTKANADVSGCKILKKYFAQLHMLKSRFPMEQGDELDKFFDMPNPVTVDDIRFEMACIMHNIGALHSSVGASDSRMSAEGMKSSCTHFQCAAWAFQHLRDKMSAANFSADFDKSLLSWYSALMLAQAQECILEKSMVDNRKNSIVAKVSMQVADYYKQCSAQLEAPSIPELVGNSKCKTWKKFCQLKDCYYTGIAYLYMGQSADEQQKMGERLAWYQEALKKLEEANKLGAKENHTIKDPLKFTTDVITVKKDNAQKENDFIFHEKVPSLDNLPELKGVPLVKGIEFNPLDTEISGPDIFGALVPLSVHQANSLYSEEKAKLLRKVTERVEEKNRELDAYMNSLQLDRLSLSKEFSQLPIPEALLERSAAFNYETDAVPKLVDSLQRVTGCYQEADSKLLDLEQRLNDSEKEIRGVEAKIPKSKGESMLGNLLPRLDELRPELDQYRQAHLSATQTNTELQKAVATHSEHLNILALPLADLKKSLPAPPVEPSTAPETLELKKLLDKVEEMKNQRQVLVDQLRDTVHKDDLTRVILSEKEAEPEEIFGKELKKHDEKIAVLDQNLAAQGNILKALTEANAKYADLRRETTEASRLRDNKIMGLIAAYDTYSDVKEKSEKGRQFYEKLLKGLNDLDDKMESLEEEWKQTKERMKRQFREEEEKRIAEETAQSIAQSAPVPSVHLPANSVAASSGSDRPKGERLKDYLEYYRAKKAGTNPISPAVIPVDYGTAGVQQNVIPPLVSSTSALSYDAFPLQQNGFGTVRQTVPASIPPQSYASPHSRVVGGGQPQNVQNTVPQACPLPLASTQEGTNYGQFMPGMQVSSGHSFSQSQHAGALSHQPVSTNQPVVFAQQAVNQPVSGGNPVNQHLIQPPAQQALPVSQTVVSVPRNQSPQSLRTSYPGAVQSLPHGIHQTQPSAFVYQTPNLATRNIQYLPGTTQSPAPGGPQAYAPCPQNQPFPASLPQANQYTTGTYAPGHSVVQQMGYSARNLMRPAQSYQQQVTGYQYQNPQIQAYPQYQVRPQQTFGGIDAPVEGSGMILPTPLQPQKASDKPAVKEMTQTEKELADVFG